MFEGGPGLKMAGKVLSWEQSVLAYLMLF